MESIILCSVIAVVIIGIIIFLVCRDTHPVIIPDNIKNNCIKTEYIDNKNTIIYSKPKNFADKAKQRTLEAKEKERLEYEETLQAIKSEIATRIPELLIDIKRKIMNAASEGVSYIYYDFPDNIIKLFITNKQKHLYIDDKDVEHICEYLIECIKNNGFKAKISHPSLYTYAHLHIYSLTSLFKHRHQIYISWEEN